MNVIGLVAAASAFASIWLGHVAVRKIEYASPTIRLPALTFVSLGLLVGWLSFVSPSIAASTALGIVAITLLWDALELVRQQARVHRGHAPANPRNPRHASFLAQAGSRATTIDRLRQEPVGGTR